MNKFLDRAVNNPKTTINGVLSFIAITSVVISPYVTQPKYAAALAIAAGLARAYMGAMQQDSGTQLAILPGQTQPQVVPSHEVPDIKGAVPVKETDSGTKKA